MWTDPGRPDDQQETADSPGILNKLLDRLDAHAAQQGTPLAVQIYAGHRYPEAAHWQGTGHIPADPGDGPRPVLLLTVGADTTPLYWISPDGQEYTSKGPGNADEPEFEYLYGGQESYAPASTLIPAKQARAAAEHFHTTNGQRPDTITWQN
jgi:hypothetical protein